MEYKKGNVSDLLIPLFGALLFLIAISLVFFYAPIEKTMGIIQKIFYFHVASAWVGFIGFFFTFISGILFLIKKNRDWDTLAQSSAEIGLVFISATLLTGMLWAKPVWGKFWVWEPRLTISAVQWLVYLAYLFLRHNYSSSEMSAQFAAVYGCIAFVTVPLSWFAIRWWRSIHPQILSSTGMEISPKMVFVLVFSILTMSYLFFMLLRIKIQIIKKD
ncbi:MAG: cytochrome c biogenesis protein CcsA [Anaerolineales bacterium]|nr:cytochrome c biogenesis protein CcsA [Anaerolineales bacterium]